MEHFYQKIDKMESDNSDNFATKKQNIEEKVPPGI